MINRKEWWLPPVFLLLAVTSLAQSRPGENRAADRAPISGTVLTTDGEPISSSFVVVSRIGATTSVTVKVEANGLFKSEPLEAGVYRISAMAPGYVYDPQSMSGGNSYHPGDSVSIKMIRGSVITGKVTNADNSPVIAANVRAIRVKDQNGKLVPFQNIVRERFTDDRGIYRMYGLAPGSYVVSAGGPLRFPASTPSTQYETNAPTYSPSSTRDGALELQVSSGEEITMDIQYRGDPGHAVSGTVAGLITQTDNFVTSATISLIEVRTRAGLLSSNASSYNNYSFVIYGVPDGEYEISAVQNMSNRDNLSSSPARITVQGSDVTGIKLALRPGGVLDGRVVLEPDPRNSCAQRKSSALRETLVSVRRFEPEASRARAATATQPEVPLLSQLMVTESVVDAQGTFNIRNLQPGAYKIDPREPGSGWYIRSITLAAGARMFNVPRDGVPVKPSEHVSGITLTLKEGAAQLRGRISLGEGHSLPPAVRVYLAPAEKEEAENILRFYEMRPEANGSFTVDNLAPGKYWITARPSEENETGATKSIRLDAAFRSRVFSEAEAGKKEIGFKPCEQIANYDLPYPIPAIPR